MDREKVYACIRHTLKSTLNNCLDDYANSRFLGFTRLRELIRGYSKDDVCNHYKSYEPFKGAQIDHFSFLHATRYVGYRFNIRQPSRPCFPLILSP